MSRKKKPIIETHGKVEDGQPTSLEQVWGSNDMARFGTGNETEFKAKVQEMNRPDLEDLARRLGIVIVESTARLRDKLVSEFHNYQSLLRRPNFTPPIVKLDDVSRKVLAEGK